MRPILKRFMCGIALWPVAIGWWPVVGAIADVPEPLPPCAAAAGLYPPYATVDAPPNTYQWHNLRLQGISACVGWADEFQMMIATSGRFHDADNIDAVISRIGAISTRTSMTYWSTTDGAWRVLTTHATALQGPDLAHPRGDFSIDEMRSGKDLYFLQRDGRTSQDVIYRMRSRVVGQNHGVIETENVTTVRWFGYTLFPAGTLRDMCWITRDDRSVWALYDLAGVTSGASVFARGHDASYLNRAEALYRYISGLPPRADHR